MNERVEPKSLILSTARIEIYCTPYRLVTQACPVYEKKPFAIAYLGMHSVHI